MMKRSALLCALVLTAPLACRPRVETGAVKDASAGTTFLETLATKDDYLSLVATNPEGFTHVKFTYELTGSEKIYFQNTAQYDYHLPFLVANIPAYSGLDPRVFEELIFMPLPKDLSAGAIYYSDSVKIPGSTTAGTLGFVLYQSALDLDEIERTFKRIKAAVPFAADRIAFMFERQQDYFSPNKQKLKDRGIPSMLATAFAGRGDRPQTYNAATSYGYLRKLSAAQVEAGEYTPRDILLLDELPIDVGPSAGILSATPQIPSSHVVLRAINQKIPDLFVPNAASYPAVSQNINKLVQFAVTANGQFTIKNEAEFAAGELNAKAQDYFKNRVPALPELVADLTVNDFFAFGGTPPTPALVKSYGAKGTNFAILDRALGENGIDRNKFKGSFLIPFTYFARHLAQPLTADMCKKGRKECLEDVVNGCDKPATDCNGFAGKPATEFLMAMVREEHVATMLADPAYRKGYLGFARGLIQKMPAISADVSRLESTIRAAYPATTRMRFRSSTNSEDLPGLNGAGLYTSKAGCLADSGMDDGPSACTTQAEIDSTNALIAKLQNLDAARYSAMIAEMRDDLTKRRPIDKAIRKVMASLWTERAFLTRDYYRIPHMNVYMGILCHPSFAEETANGVAVIKINPADPTSLSMSVVTQIDDISITNPEIFGAIPDQLSFKYGADGQVTDIAYGLRSNQSGGAAILNDAQIKDLAKQMAVTYRALRAAYGESELNAVLDMEFKRTKEGQMEIKQARPL